MRAFPWILAFIFLIAIWWTLFISREDFYLLWPVYSIAFGSYFLLVFGNPKISLTAGMALAIAARLSTFMFDPLLTDDYFRFIWDGMVMHEGINPAAYTPAFLMSHSDMGVSNPWLYENLNSKDYYTVYPPIMQAVFYMSYAVNYNDIAGHLVFLRSLVFLADAAIVFILWKILRKSQRPVHAVLIYALNPLIILEFMGNAHLDGIMIAGLLAAIYLVMAKREKWSTLFMALSICTKMLTLVLMPFMPKSLYPKKIIWYIVVTSLLTILSFVLFFRGHNGWVQSVALWFRSFEFNASLYYVAQWFHAGIKGYEDIHIIGPVMMGITAALIVVAWIWYLRRKELKWPVGMLMVLVIYFLMTTTLHPWYLGILLAISVVSGYLFPVVWTYLVFLSYSHYDAGSFSEKYLLIASEYFLLLAFMLFEWKHKKSLRVGAKAF